MNVIFVLFKTVAFCQILFKNRHDFVGLRLEEVERFDESLQKSINGFLIFFNVVRRREQRGVVNYRPVGEVDDLEPFLRAVEIEGHVHQCPCRFAGGNVVDEFQMLSRGDFSRFDIDLIRFKPAGFQYRSQIAGDARGFGVTDNLLAFQVLHVFDLRIGDEPIVPVVLCLRQISEPFFAFGALPVGFVMQAAEKIDFSGEGQLGSVGHGRRFGSAYNVKIDFESVFFHHAGFFKDEKKG